MRFADTSLHSILITANLAKMLALSALGVGFNGSPLSGSFLV
jgi:hypothetical protein